MTINRIDITHFLNNYFSISLTYKSKRMYYTDCLKRYLKFQAIYEIKTVMFVSYCMVYNLPLKMNFKLYGNRISDWRIMSTIIKKCKIKVTFCTKYITTE